MMKISIIDSSAQRRVVLEGKMIVPWITELKSALAAANTDLQGRELVIDMVGVSVISLEAETILMQLKNQGARFRYGGIYTKHLLRHLTRKSKKGSA